MLSGRRLFYGETDFATVKQVQQAQIPALRAENPAIPADLDTILAKALAREPTARYATARDLGRDLTAFLYRHGRPVTAYDIANVVRAAVALRKKSQPDRASIIDKLIEEALLEFTSLQDEKGGPAQRPAQPVDEPLKLGFEDIGHWADELGPVSRKPISAPAIEVGNLAALEETDPKMSGMKVQEVARVAASLSADPLVKMGGDPPHPPARPVVREHGASASPSSAPPARESEAPLATTTSSPRKGTAIVAAIIAIVVAAVGAWLAMGK